MKSNRAQQIEECILIVSKYFDVDANKVLTAIAPKNPKIQLARHMIWFHLHDCGMSFLAIGRIFGNLSIDHVQKYVKQSRIRLDEEDQLLLATLPRITTTLEITSPAEMA